MKWQRISLAAVMILTLSVFAGADENPAVIPHVADITAADQAAAERLGPDRGALAVQSDVRTIQRIVSSASGVVLNIDQAIVDLKADVRENEILIQLSSDVLFDFDKSEIKAEAEPELSKVALIIREKAKGTVSIFGHTDAKGSDEYNQKLSVRRAEVVRRWLIKKGGADAKYKVQGFGETKPVAPNINPDGTDNPDGRAKNRRVEIVIQVKENK
jgi:outer membrane protein OmpA-like peptidoglycan-associated protein